MRGNPGKTIRPTCLLICRIQIVVQKVALNMYEYSMDRITSYVTGSSLGIGLSQKKKKKGHKAD